ncbi:MAG TPA: tetratricopeptide repeat protein [Gemmatimonadaceae bacterium]|nr:tetratricopeptide repeat protein [Gemmatimonadaceae bacterium]
MSSRRGKSRKAESREAAKAPEAAKPKLGWRNPLTIGVAVVAIAIALLAGTRLLHRPPNGESADGARVALPPPVDSVLPPAPVASDFAGSERCASCHQAQYAAWRGSTHGNAGGTPGSVKVIAPFNGTPIRFRDAVVIPSAGRGYTFTVRQEGRPERRFTVDGVIGGGHMVGGGTQAFVSRFADGTWRMLPFDWSKQTATWFCNTESRSNKGWVPITADLRLADCGDWPPQRILGDEPRFANCQGCHGSRIDVRFDSVAKKWNTSIATLAIDCESCHGPAKRHVELMNDAARNGKTQPVASASRAAADIGLRSLATLSKDPSLGVCFQCHSLKSQLARHYEPGAPLTTYYALRLAQLGDAALLPDGRTRTFAYQEGHLSSACYVKGGMTCTSCHDPHSQGYRDVFGTPLASRFDDRQCTSCHASKATSPTLHTKHAAASEGSRCTSCHMPYLQEQEIGHAIRYARSDHTISIPRPAFDSSQGLTSACKGCHADRSVAALDAQVRTWYGTLAPHDSAVAGLTRVAEATSRAAVARLLLVVGSRHTSALLAGLARFVETQLAPDMSSLEPDVVDRLRALAGHPDTDVRATALAALHFARGNDPDTRRFLAAALTSLGANDAAVRGRWALVLGFLADSLVSHGDPAGAVATYRKAIEIAPRDPRLHLSLGLAQAEAGETAKAIASYQRSLSLDAQQPLALVNLGIALEGSGDTSGAERAYQQAIAVDPNEPLAYFNLGNIYLQRGDAAGAIPRYERATQLNPSLSTGYFYLADAYARTGAVERALDAVRRGLEFDPQNANGKLAEEKLKQALGSR